MNFEGQLVQHAPEERLLSKEAIQLPPQERLSLLLNARYYPIVKKRTSAESQIREMMDLYKFFALMLTYFFPDDKAVDNYIALELLEMVNQKNPQMFVSPPFEKAFKLVKEYERLERMINSVRDLFISYEKTFPDIYEMYGLERYVDESLLDMRENARYVFENNPGLVEEIKRRWGIS